MWQPHFVSSAFGQLLDTLRADPIEYRNRLYIVSCVLGYLLGSIPVGYLVGRRYGIDIREHGSGNIGATNVVRVLGKKPGYFVFLCDLLKGFLSARLGMWMAAVFDPWVPAVFIHQHVTYMPTPWHARTVALAGILAAFSCTLGHNFPVWLRFRGGKGVATTIGVLLGLMPAAFLVAAVVWIVSFYALRYVSLASLLAAATLPPTVWLLTRYMDPWSSGFGPMFWFSIAAAALVFLRHRTNIQRLLNGTESRFARKPKAHVDPAV